jgi:hypothetical protein
VRLERKLAESRLVAPALFKQLLAGVVLLLQIGIVGHHRFAFSNYGIKDIIKFSKGHRVRTERLVQSVARGPNDLPVDDDGNKWRARP